MALRATNEYLRCDPTDADFIRLLQSFFGVSNVSDRARELIQWGMRNTSYLNRVQVVNNNISLNSWFRSSTSVLECWSDKYGWARALLCGWIKVTGSLDHMFYPLSSELPCALCTNAAHLDEKLSWLGRTVTDLTPFPYKVSRALARELSLSYGDGSKYYSDLIFSIGNYLGRVPTISEVRGSVELPTPAVRESSFVLEVGDGVLSNERKLSLLNLIARNRMADPVEGVLFKTCDSEIRSVCEMMFAGEILEMCYELPAVKHAVVKRLINLEIPTDSYEGRVEATTVLQSLVRRDLAGLLPFKDETSLNENLASGAALKQEVYLGDPRAILGKSSYNYTATTLMRVGSSFNKEQYSELTRRLVMSLLTRNPTLVANFVECVLILLQRYIHYRTNALRFINLPTKLQVMLRGMEQTVDFSGVDETFASLQHSIPEVERAWCAPLATVAYFLLKDTGGSFAKWKDLSHLPSCMNFDFVGFVDPRVLTAPERMFLSEVLARFKTRKTLVRGFPIAGRAMNPIDLAVDKLDINDDSKPLLKKLLKKGQ